MTYRLPLLLALLFSALSAGTVLAQPSFGPAEGPGEGRPPHGAPPEAVAACQNKAAGAACSFTGRRQESMSGTCASVPSGPPPANSGTSSGTAATSSGTSTALACRPAQPPASPQR